MITAATLATPMALFTRRSRSGWLDELDGIRGEALSLPDGEVATAMADAQPLPEVDADRSPLTQFEAPLPPARPAPAAAPLPPEAAAPLSWSAAPDPEPAAATPPASPAVPPAPPVAAAPPEATPDLSTLPPPPPTAGDPSTDAELLLPPSSTQPAPHPIRPQEMWHPAVVPTPPPPPAPAPVDEEQVDPAELVDAEPDAPSSRFRFARLRPVLPADEVPPAPPVATADEADEQPPYSLIEELLAPYGVPPAETDPGPVGHGSAPFVPAVTPVAGHTLINGPVNRRTQRDDEFVRRRDLNSTLPPERLAARPPVGPLDAPAAFAPTPTPTPLAADAPTRREATSPAAAGPVEPPAPVAEVAADPVGIEIVLPGDLPEASEPVVPEPEPAAAPRSLPVIGIQADGTTAAPEALVQPAPVPAPAMPAPVAAPAPVAVPAREAMAAPEPEPVPEPAPVAEPVVLPVAADRTVALDGGHLRLADDCSPDVVATPDGVRLQLDAGWCWTVLAAGAPAGPVTVALPVGTLTVPAGATALAVVEADRTTFVVVVAGEASLAHAGGRMRLRPGAMALAPLGAEPQVDVASEDEIGTDPLVAHNRQLDAG